MKASFELKFPVSNRSILDLKLLEPGDIILSRPATLDSAAIAFFGASEFSHAQLVVQDGVMNIEAVRLPHKSRGSVIEATTAVDEASKQLVGGIGIYRFPRWHLVESAVSEIPTGSVSPLASYARFEVFRHRDAKTEAFEEFIKVGIESACQKYKNEPYARLIDRLVNNAIMVAVPKGEHASVETEGFCGADRSTPPPGVATAG